MVTAVDVKENEPGVVTVTVTAFEATVAPLVPVTVTVYALKDVVTVVATVKVEVCAAPRTTEVGLNEQVGVEVRFDGATLQVSATVPVNPLTGATVITDVPEVPATTVGLVAELTVKVGAAATVTVTGADAGDTR